MLPTVGLIDIAHFEGCVTHGQMGPVDNAHTARGSLPKPKGKVILAGLTSAVEVRAQGLQQRFGHRSLLYRLPGALLAAAREGVDGVALALNPVESRAGARPTSTS